MFYISCWLPISLASAGHSRLTITMNFRISALSALTFAIIALQAIMASADSPSPPGDDAIEAHHAIWRGFEKLPVQTQRQYISEVHATCLLEHHEQAEFPRCISLGLAMKMMRHKNPKWKLKSTLSKVTGWINGRRPGRA